MQFEFLFEWVREWLSTHPEWLKLFIANNQDKNKWDWRGGEYVDPCVHETELWAPFKPIPNVRKFKVKLSVKDELAASFGIKKKFRPKFEYETYVNSHLNEYAFDQIQRLRKMASENPGLYWRTVRNLMRYSRTFFIMSLHHVEPKWHREIPLWKIVSLWKRVSRMALSKKLNVKYFRIYILKSNGKLRPLGPPSLEWRLYLHTLNNFIMLYMESRKVFKSERQHGFRSHKGTGTAWKDIFSKVIKSDWIFEFDLKRCFDNISVKGISKALRKEKVPQHWISKLEYLNMTPVQNPLKLKWDMKEANAYNKYLMRNYGFTDEMLIKNPNLSKIPESEFVTVDGNLDEDLKLDLIFHNYNLALNYQPERPKDEKHPFMSDNKILADWEEGMTYRANTKLIGEINSMDLEHNWKHLIHIIGSEDRLKWKSEGKATMGIPQGLPTSPYLTILSIEKNLIEKTKAEMLMYADDGIFYGSGIAPDHRDLMKDNEKAGIEFSKEKSDWIKKDGKWIKPLKFLGMEFDGTNWKASTRNNASLVYDKDNLVKVMNICETLSIDSYDKEKIQDLKTKDTWEHLLISKLFGLIQSRMYQDSWLVDALNQNFNLTKIKSSWADLYNGLELTVFNSTSIASNDILRLLRKQKLGRGSKKP